MSDAELQKRLRARSNHPESDYAEAADAIERLTAELATVKAERDEAREALRFYADRHENPNDGPWGINSMDFGDVARKALEGRP